MVILCDIGQTQQAMELYAQNMKISENTIYIATLLKTIAEYNGIKKVKCQNVCSGRDENY